MIGTKERKPTVFIVDDDDAVRHSLQLLFKSLDLPSVGCASSDEFLKKYDPAQPGCVLLDVRMPGMSGLDLQLELNRLGAIIPVIFITGHGDVPMAVAAVQQGAFDFLQKPFRDQELIDRVQRALASDQQQRLQLGESDRIRGRLESLTPREREVLNLVTQGKANKVMAGDLHVSQRTIEIHRAHLMEKMQASSLAQLVRMTMTVD
jgi:FixJ family two-component response regulator